MSEDRESKLLDKIAQAYQVIGALADAAGVFEHPEMQATLSHFSEPDEHLDDDLLPWPKVMKLPVFQQAKADE